MARWLDSDAEALYNRMGGLSGDIQDVVSAIESIPGASDYSTVLNSIDSKIKDYTNNFASVENKLQSIINNLVNVNTGLTNIKGDTGSIVTNTANTNTKLDTVITKLGILDDNYTPSNLIQIIYRRNTGSYMYPNAEPVTSNYNPLNVTYVSADSNNQFRVQVAGTGAKRSIYTMLGYTNTNIVSLFSAMQTLGTTYRVQKLDYSDGTPQFDEEGTGWNYTYSLADQLHYMNVNMASFFSRMGFVLADDDTIAAKNANKPQEQAVLNQFTGTGNASASVSDYSDIASGLGSVKGGITTNVSVSNAFGIFNNNDGYNWFTSNTANNLNISGQNNRKSANEVEYTYYNSQLEAIYNAMGVKYD